MSGCGLRTLRKEATMDKDVLIDLVLVLVRVLLETIR